MRRSVRGEVIASSNDHTPEEHIRLAQLAVDAPSGSPSGAGRP
jgi:transcription termination factor Rho